MTDRLYMINADDPSAFQRRTLTVVRDNVRLGAQTGLMVTIDPALDTRDGPLDTALLLPRHVGRTIGELRQGRPLHVYVCRVLKEDATDELAKQDVTIEIWGLVGESPTLGAADIFR